MKKRLRIQKKRSRPDLVDERPEEVMFHAEGSTGWGRVRNLGDYKGTKKEANFADQHHRFAGPGDVA